MVKNVQEDVKYELNHYPCNTNSLERLLEIHLVIKGLEFKVFFVYIFNEYSKKFIEDMMLNK